MTTMTRSRTCLTVWGQTLHLRTATTHLADAQVGEAYYKLKGFKDQDRYKSVKESARVGGFVEIGGNAPSAVKLWLTPMGEAAIRQLPDADAEGAD